MNLLCVKNSITQGSKNQTTCTYMFLLALPVCLEVEQAKMVLEAQYPYLFLTCIFSCFSFLCKYLNKQKSLTNHLLFGGVDMQTKYFFQIHCATFVVSCLFTLMLYDSKKFKVFLQCYVVVTVRHKKVEQIMISCKNCSWLLRHPFAQSLHSG